MFFLFKCKRFLKWSNFLQNFPVWVRNLQDKLFREIRKRRTLAESKTKDRSGKDGRYCSKAIEELGWRRYIHNFFHSTCGRSYLLWKAIQERVFSPFFSLKQNKVNSKNWGKSNFDMSKKQKDVWDVFFKRKGRMMKIYQSSFLSCYVKFIPL